MTNNIPVCECRLRLSRSVKLEEAPQLRSFFGREFEQQVFAHNHGEDGAQIHQYPRIQFKVIESAAVLLGIGAGAEVLKRLWLELDHTTLGGGKLQVVESGIETRNETIDATDDPITYRFLTPWLGLNQKNFRSYTGSRNQGFRKSELSRILVGNCLGLADTLGIRFGGQIEADGRKLTSIKTTLNGNPMIGFVGRFTINLALPELIGLGKSVSRGFGTVSTANF
jgi:hypothetical protein